MKSTNKKILVTGSSGFIGRYVVQELINNGDFVFGLDIKPPKFNFSLKNFEWINFDIRNGTPKINSSLDKIIHLAAYPIPVMCEKKPDIAFATNVYGTYNILNLAKEKKISKFIFPSSALLYKNISETLINEKHPLQTTNTIYNITKKLGEDLCTEFKHNYNFSLTILRLFNVFGPFQSTDYLIPTIINQALHGKIELWSRKPSRDFNYVENTVDAILKTSNSNSDEVFNVGSGEEHKVSEIASYIASKFDSEILYLNKKVQGPSSLKCDNSKLMNSLNWAPKISFYDGLDKTIDWFKKNNHENSYT